jgi:hypothetical protein
MSVDNLLNKLVTRTISGNRRAPAAAHSLELHLAKSVIETLGSFKAAHPEFTDEMAGGALRMVVKCIDENGGAIS